jgi:hypothetical protein
MRRIAGLAILVLAYGQVAQAQVTTYSDRAAWNSAAGAFILTEDLNSFVTDTSFQGAVVPLLNMTITEGNGPPFNNPVNFVDVFPFEEDGKRSIDGTTYVLGEVVENATTIRIDFASPVTGWGADFVSHDAATVIDVFDQFDNLIGTTAQVGAETTFYGFLLGPGQSAGRIELRFSSITNDLFGMDNLSLVDSSAPPSPVTLTENLAVSVTAMTTLDEGHRTSLTRKLDAVLALISNGGTPGAGGQTRAAVNILNAFVLEVQALVSNGSLTSGAGQALIAEAAVIAALLA